MMPSPKFCKASMIAVAMTLACSAAKAEAPDATITFKGGNVAFIAGVSWGGGTLHYKGKNIPIKVGGLSVGAIGAKQFHATGNVYHLKKVADIEGTYAAIGAGITVGGGAGGMAMQNGNGVVIQTSGTSLGADLKIGPSGVNIKLK
jgi:hypothetical protein